MARLSPVQAVPRVALTELPTPLEEAPRLSRELGVRVLLKRDDLTSPGLGGNKVRKLQFIMADVLREGADCVVTGGGPQSNHARLTAAVARRLGLDPYLVFWGSDPADRANSGNYLLDRILEATVTFTDSPDRSSVEPAIDALCARLRAAGRRPYPIPRGGASALGCLGYVECATELARQLDHAGAKRVDVVVACGSCGTQAGLWVGFAHARPLVRVLGVTVSRPRAECEARIAALGREVASLVGLPLPDTPPVIVDGYLGPGYGLSSPQAQAAIRLVALSEGLFLDPVYTGKAMAGLVDLARHSAFEKTDAVVFIHTGGVPELFGANGTEGVTGAST
jgi:D-cysteine desulfhydrase